MTYFLLYVNESYLLPCDLNIIFSPRLPDLQRLSLPPLDPYFRLLLQVLVMVDIPPRHNGSWIGHAMVACVWLTVRALNPVDASDIHGRRVISVYKYVVVPCHGNRTMIARMPLLVQPQQLLPLRRVRQLLLRPPLLPQVQLLAQQAHLLEQ